MMFLKPALGCAPARVANSSVDRKTFCWSSPIAPVVRSFDSRICDIHHSMLVHYDRTWRHLDPFDLCTLQLR